MYARLIEVPKKQMSHFSLPSDILRELRVLEITSGSSAVGVFPRRLLLMCRVLGLQVQKFS